MAIQADTGEVAEQGREFLPVWRRGAAVSGATGHWCADGRRCRCRTARHRHRARGARNDRPLRPRWRRRPHEPGSRADRRFGPHRGSTKPFAASSLISACYLWRRVGEYAAYREHQQRADAPLLREREYIAPRALVHHVEADHEHLPHRTPSSCSSASLVKSTIGFSVRPMCRILLGRLDGPGHKKAYADAATRGPADLRSSFRLRRPASPRIVTSRGRR